MKLNKSQNYFGMDGGKRKKTEQEKYQMDLKMEKRFKRDDKDMWKSRCDNEVGNVCVCA